ncbi:MAG: hypothetical protein H6825_11960 [Planctomycetes bacterium]|nr:hypothetical protein [Planctomycetota bacterium]
MTSEIRRAVRAVLCAALLGLAALPSAAQDVPDASDVSAVVDDAARDTARARLVDALQDGRASLEALLVESLLVTYGVDATEAALAQAADGRPDDDDLRMALGFTQALAAVEHLVAGLQRHGVFPDRAGMASIVFEMGGLSGALREVFPPPDDPQPISYADLRALVARWIDDLARATDTLESVDDPAVALALRPMRIPLDVGGGRRVALGDVLGWLDDEHADLRVRFDLGDAAWLAGYCHLLAAPAECLLAVDFDELFERTAHRLFARPVTRYPFLVGEPSRRLGDFQWEEITDIVAAIHLARFPVVEPERARSALAHLERTFALSRLSWERILAETDDDAEWIPSPSQAGALRVSVTQPMLDAWLATIDELERVFRGERLIPFWRGDPAAKLGVNVRRVFSEPTCFDPVLWVQGTAAAPYLEQGRMSTLSDDAFARRMGEVFHGDPLLFAAWFN